MPALADATLDERERELLDRFVSALREQHGDDLDAVWLYGSRARGKRPHAESDSAQRTRTAGRTPARGVCSGRSSCSQVVAAIERLTA